MIWLMVGALALLVTLLAGQAVMLASLRMRVAECEEILNDAVEVRGMEDSRRAYVLARLRMYVARWGKVVVRDKEHV